MIVDEVHVFHYGTKGMKWGVKNQRLNSDTKSAAEKERQKKRVQKTVVLGAAAVGLMVLSHQLKKSGGSKPSGASINRGKEAASSILKKNSSVTFSPEMRSRIQAARSSATAGSKNHANTMKNIGARQLKVAKDSNNELKNFYNKANIPIKERTYLDTDFWTSLAG